MLLTQACFQVFFFYFALIYVSIFEIEHLKRKARFSKERMGCGRRERREWERGGEGSIKSRGILHTHFCLFFIHMIRNSGHFYRYFYNSLMELS